MPIACVHIPRFAIEAERQRRPDIAARLILIGEATVLDCSLGADPLGVRRGMRMSEAIALCPRAVVLSPDAPHYQRLFDEVLGLLDELSPSVEAGELGTAFVSLDGLGVEPDAFADGLIASLHRRLGFMASVGIAGGKFAARVAAATSRPGTAKTVDDGERGRVPRAAAVLAPPGQRGDALAAEAARPGDDRRCGKAPAGRVPAAVRAGGQALLGAGQRHRQRADRPARDREHGRPPDAVAGHNGQPGNDPRRAGAAALSPLTATARGRATGCARRSSAGLLDGGGAWELAVPFREALADPKAAWFAVKNAVTRHPPERPVEELESRAGRPERRVRQAGADVRDEGQALAAGGGGRAPPEHKREGPSIGRIVEVEPWSRIPERRTALEDFAS